MPVVDLALPALVVAEQLHHACSKVGFFHGAHERADSNKVQPFTLFLTLHQTCNGQSSH